MKNWLKNLTKYSLSCLVLFLEFKHTKLKAQLLERDLDKSQALTSKVGYMKLKKKSIKTFTKA
jgi:hypothetical protein